MKSTKNLFALVAVAAMVLFLTAPAIFAQVENPPVVHGPKFVDENGDGYNDNAPDADGDGIPNGMDEDYVKAGAGNGKGVAGAGFVDEDGDGINDNAPDADGDGIPNGQDEDYVKPQDGSGFGKDNSKGRGFGRKGRGFAGFIDEDGDGINDRMVDDDKDGIPNGQDEDWVRPEDCLGRGAQMGRGFGKASQGATPGAGAGENSGQGQRRGNGGNGPQNP